MCIYIYINNNSNNNNNNNSNINNNNIYIYTLIWRFELRESFKLHNTCIWGFGGPETSVL